MHSHLPDVTGLFHSGSSETKTDGYSSRYSPDSSRHLAEFCRDSKDMGVSQIFVPGIGETVDATSERHIYQVRNQ